MAKTAKPGVAGEAWVHKYAPRGLDDMVGNQTLVSDLGFCLCSDLTPKRQGILSVCMQGKRLCHVYQCTDAERREDWGCLYTSFMKSVEEGSGFSTTG